VWIDIFRALAVAGGPARTGSHRQFGRRSASLRLWRQRGERNQAIGRSRGGRTTKIRLLLEQMPHASILHGDKGYDCNAIRRRIEGKASCQYPAEGQSALKELLFAIPVP
jgi:hypothetical protein